MDPSPTLTHPEAALTLYRVEHWHHDRVTALGVIAGEVPHRNALDPFVSRLIHEGAAGVVVLIEMETGSVVAERIISPPDRARVPSAGRPRRYSSKPARRSGEG